MKQPRQSGLERIDLVIILSVIFFLGSLAVAAALTGGEALWNAVTGLGVGLIALALGLSLVNYAVRALRWHLYSRHLGLNLPLRTSSLYYVAGFALTATPGKLGEALRVWLMERAHGFRYERTVPLLVADRASDLIGIAAISLIGLGTLVGPAWAPALALALIGVLLFVLARPALGLAVFSGLYRVIGRWPRLFAALRRTVRHTSRLFTPRILALSTGLAIVGWLAECIAFALILHGLGLDLDLRYAIVIFSVSMILGSLTMLPGGVGGTEATMLAMLTSFGVAFDPAVAATTVIRVTTLWFAVMLGFMVLPMVLRRVRRGRAASPATAVQRA